MTSQRRDLFATDAAVIITGDLLGVARQAVAVAQIARRRNGLPDSGGYADLLAALSTAMSRARHNDVAPQPDMPASDQPDQLTVDEAVTVLGMSKRQVQRLAPQLGGRLVGGRWLLDRLAVNEHREGTKHGSRQAR